MNHKKTAIKIFEAVGGDNNINDVQHCITRLRFKLKDTTVPNKEQIEQIEGVISVIIQGGQYQVVIGNEVGSVYKEVEKLISFEDTIDKSESPKNAKIFDRFTSMISGIFTPVLGILCAAGLLKGLLAILIVTNLVSEGSDTYIVLNALGDSFFYFFPVFIGSSAARYFGINHFVGLAIGTTMIYPGIIEAAASNDPFSFIGIPMNIMDYSSSVFPVIVAVWVASILHKQLDKWIAQGLKYFVIPLLILIVIVPLTLLVVGPVISTISNLLADLTFAIYNLNPILAGLVLGGPWILIVMFGLHWAFIPIFINNMTTVGFDSVMGLLAANQFAMAAAAIAIGVRSTTKKEKSLTFSTGGTALLGVSEPALYGVLLPRKKPLIMSIIGGSIGGAFGGLMLSKVYAFTASGFFAIPGAINTAGIDKGFYGYVGQMIIGFIVAFVLTYFWGYKAKDTNTQIN